MTLKSLFVSVVAGLACVSCAQNGSPTGESKSGGKTLAGAADTTKGKAKPSDGTAVRIPDAPITESAPANAATPGGPDLGAAAATPKGADLSDVPPAPKEARWTLYCASIRDQNHFETSRALKDALIKRTDLREWYILHQSGESRIYYGYYRSINEPSDAAESARAQADRKKIEALKDGDDLQPFARAHFVQLNAPDPESPPEWNLVNVPEQKVWTLIIAAYKDHPDRKKFAVDAVRAARAAGEEAYYYHGENVSNVCIGSWPEEAMEEKRVDAKDGVNLQRDPLLVLPPGMKAEGQVKQKDGGNVRAVGQSYIPRDRKLIAKIEEYPEIAINGEAVLFKAKGMMRRQGSEVRRIPRPSDTLFRDNVANADNDPNARQVNGPNADQRAPQRNPYGDVDQAQPANAQPAGNRGGNSGTGGLRSIGER